MKYFRWWLTHFGLLSRWETTTNTCSLFWHVILGISYTVAAAALIYVFGVMLSALPVYLICKWLGVAQYAYITPDLYEASIVFWCIISAVASILLLTWGAFKITELRYEMNYSRRKIEKKKSKIHQLISDMVYSIKNKVCIKIDMSTWR